MRRLSMTFAAMLIVQASSVAAEPKYGPGVSDAEIKLGQTMPYSGPASAYSAYGRTMAGYFAMINSAGGVNGRKINLISLDDAFSPPITVEQTRRLVEGDEVLAIVGQMGTPTSLAVSRYLNGKKVPQLLVSSGSPKLDDAKSLPWTTIFYASQIVEGRIFGKFLLKTKPDAKLGILYQNDDYGRGYVAALKQELGDKAASMIVKEIPYELTEPTIESAVVSLRASGADTFFDASSPKFAAQAIRKAHEIGWAPLHIILTAAAQISATLKPAGIDASIGVVTAIWLKSVDDPKWSNDKDVQEFLAFMKRWSPQEAPTDTVNGLAYSTAQLMVQILQNCGEDLTQANVLKQATNLHDLQLPLFIPGVTINTSSEQRTPWRSAQMVKFDGTSWVPLGDLVEISDLK
jgi:branched-chain amino acid transport system substrate-binding protein